MIKKIMAILLSVVLFVAGFSVVSNQSVVAKDAKSNSSLYGISGPRRTDGKVIYDTVKFGKYPNRESDDIQWRVLSVNGNDAFLLSDKVLCEKKHSDSDTSVSWETSKIRTYLNESFYNDCFDDVERDSIFSTDLETTTDKIFLLSEDDISNEKYGFDSNEKLPAITRIGYKIEDGNPCSWWLRDSGVDSTYPFNHFFRTISYKGSIGARNVTNNEGVRPALHLNLSSTTWEKGETIQVEDGYEYEMTCGERASCKFDKDEGVLTISGIGELYDFSETSCPWSSISSLIKKIIVESGITKIDGCSGLDNLETVEIKEGVKEIGDKAFLYCSKLKTVEIANSVKEIGAYAFNTTGPSPYDHEVNLEKVILPDQLEEVGIGAFPGSGYDSGGTKYPNNTIYYVSDNTYAKQLCVDNGFVYALKSDSPGFRTLYGKCGENINWSLYEDGTLRIRGEGKIADFDCRSYTSYPKYPTWYNNVDNIKTVYIGDGITYVGNYSFSEMNNLENINLSDSVTTIGNNVMGNSTSFEKFFYTNNISKIDGINVNVNVDDCSIEILNDIPESYSQSFFAKGIKKIIVNNLVQEVDLSRFYNLNDIEELELPEELTSVRFYGLSTYNKLKWIYVPDNTRISFFSHIPVKYRCSDDILLSVKSGSQAERDCIENNLNYTTIRSKEVLPVSVTNLKVVSLNKRNLVASWDNDENQRYKVFLDGVLMKETDSTSISLTGLSDGKHTLTVKSYVEGSKKTIESEEESITFTVFNNLPTEVEGLTLLSKTNDSATITWIETEEQASTNQNFNLYVDGKFYKTYDSATTVLVEGLEAGEHIFKVVGENCGNYTVGSEIKVIINDATTEIPTVEPTTEMPTVEPTTVVPQPTTKVVPTTKVIPTKKVIKPGKVKIKKIDKRKKSAKKMKVTFKKIANAKGYQVAVYKTKKNAKKNKKALVRKYTTKTKYTIKSKKLKKKKTLYVKARAYNLDGTTKVFGAWSAIKKSKAK